MILLISSYIIVFSVFTIGRYERYNATGFDLGIYSQVTWNTAHGHIMQNTTAEQDNFFGIHAALITIWLAPAMRLWPDPRMLLIAQTTLLALGAWPVARLAGRVFAQRSQLAVFFAALWLLYPAVGWMNRWDFHEIVPAATFLAFAFEAADRRAWRQTDFWLLVSLLCKEEVGLNIAGFAVYMARRYDRARWPCALWFVAGTGWFASYAFIIAPALNEVNADLSIHTYRYDWLLSRDLQRIWDHLSGSTIRLKITYLIELFALLAFVPLAAPLALIPALPTFGLSVLSAHTQQGSVYLHYNAAAIPALMIATIFGLARLEQRFKHGLAGGVMVLICATLLGWVFYNPLMGTPKRTNIYGWESGAHRAALNEVRTLIPADACVVAENNIQPHYSLRHETYVLGARGTGPEGDRDGCTYMIIDLGDRRFDDFVVGEDVACYQFWSQKRAPIYFRDTVVVLQWQPVEVDPIAWQQMNDYCAAHANPA